MVKIGYKFSGTGRCIMCGARRIQYYTNRLLANNAKPAVCDECLKDYYTRPETIERLKALGVLN